MSVTTQIANLLRKSGYKKEKTLPEVNLYLKWHDERFATGFSIIKTSKEELPIIGYGLLDVKLTKLQNKIEHTEEFGLYHLTDGKELIYCEQAIAATPKAVDAFLEMLNDQILNFDRDLPHIIDSYKESMKQFKPLPYFVDEKGYNKGFGPIYFGLMYLLLENSRLTQLDISNAIEYATQLGVNNKDFQFKLGLVRDFTGT